jgi:hypothetical protein
MFKRLFFCFFILTSVLLSFGQLPAQSDVSVLLRYENNVYFKMHTQGWGFGYRTGFHQTAMKKRMYDFSFFTMKHPKEVRISGAQSDFSAKSYIYGKLNSVFLLQGSIGTMRILNEKPYWGGIEFRTFMSVGPVIGFTKPVYLYIIPNNSLEKYDPEKHFYDNIYGRGPFLKGFDEIKLHPGAYVKAGVNFEHGTEESRVRALEAGFMVCAFVKPLEIMSFSKNYNVFATLYLSYHFGSRKN